MGRDLKPKDALGQDLRLTKDLAAPGKDGLESSHRARFKAVFAKRANAPKLAERLDCSEIIYEVHLGDDALEALIVVNDKCD